MSPLIADNVHEPTYDSYVLQGLDAPMSALHEKYLTIRWLDQIPAGYTE